MTFIGFLDTPFLVPIIALYAADLGAGVATVGLIVGVYSITNTAANVLGGNLVDRYGYKPPLLVGLAGDAVSMFAYALCRLPWHLAVVRALHGAGGGLVGPSTMSYTALSYSKQRLGRGMALYGMAIGSATLLGTAGGGIIGDRFGYQYLFYIGGSLLLASVAMAALLRKRATSALAKRRGLGNGLKDTVRLLADVRFRLPYLSILAQYFAFGGIVTLLPLYLKGLGMTASLDTGILIAAFSAVFILVQFPAGGLSDRVGRLLPATVGLGIAGMSVVLLPIFPNMPFMIAIMVLFGLGYGLFFPALSAMVADKASPEEYGRATGLFHALLTVGVSVGAPVMGWIASYTGASSGLSLSSVPLLVSLAIAMVILINQKRPSSGRIDHRV